MNMTELSSRFEQWMDGVLWAPLPEGILAFNINMYELDGAHGLELVGCPTYDPADPDWASDEIFMSDEPRFELSHDVVGKKWEQGLDAAMQMLKSYLNGESDGAKRLRESKAVTVGFVDGDLQLIWQQS
jgi:hypothetical protein